MNVHSFFRYRSSRVLIALFLTAVCATGVFANSHGSQPLLVDGDWVVEHSANIHLIDIGRSVEDFEAGHIPGSVHFDRSGIYGEVDGVPGMFPGVRAATEAIEAAGISTDTHVVIYDAANSLWSTRLFWTLEYLGHTRVSVLDGGWPKWEDEGRPVYSGPSSVEEGSFAVDVQSARLYDSSSLASQLQNAELLVIDTRSAAEFSGEDARADRGGHIPGSVNVNWVNNVIQQEGQASTFLPKDELAELYDLHGVDDSKTAVTLCQTGVRGAHTYFVLRLLGYTDVALYDGSWAEWGNSELPIE